MSLDAADEAVGALASAGADFFAGVPDSVLSDLSQALTSRSELEHLVAPNEGSAVGLGIGYFLGTGKCPVVYMQNSGLGNALNPLVSLAHNSVYAIPMLLVIGYRGRDPENDEPQHRIQGPATIPWLTAAGLVVHEVTFPEDIAETLVRAFIQAREHSSPVCVLLGPGLLDSSKNSESMSSLFPTRAEIVKFLVDQFSHSALLVSATGKTSRELAAVSDDEQAENAFLCIGGMGHAVSVALGLSLTHPSRSVICLDGDGSFQMHMGAAALVAAKQPNNLLHVVINNGVHDSVGGQATANPNLRYAEIAHHLGYSSSRRIESIELLGKHLMRIKDRSGPHFIEVLSTPGSTATLGRPKKTPRERMELFSTNGN